MKNNLNSEIERYRVVVGSLASHARNGMNGAFMVKTKDGLTLVVIASNALGWEHVSVSVYGRNRCPTWEEMCLVKDIFWDEEETVIQYHPPKSQYVSCHLYCLHLWRPVGFEIPLPPSIMVGPKKGG